MFRSHVGVDTHTAPRCLVSLLSSIWTRKLITVCLQCVCILSFWNIAIISRSHVTVVLKQGAHRGEKKKVACLHSWKLNECPDLTSFIKEGRIYNYLIEARRGGSKHGGRGVFLQRQEWRADKLQRADLVSFRVEAFQMWLRVRLNCKIDSLLEKKKKKKRATGNKAHWFVCVKG